MRWLRTDSTYAKLGRAAGADDTYTLVALLRSPPILAPGDSIYRAASLMRDSGIEILPIVRSNGRLAGVVGVDDLRPMLCREPSDEALLEPVARIGRAPGTVGRTDMAMETVRRTLAQCGDSVLFIVDADEQYTGAICLSDLLAPTRIPPRPHSVGGMATPWGVYLTDGTLQAGAGNAALAGGGMLMGLMLAGSYVAVGLICWAVQHALRWPVYTLWNADSPPEMTLRNSGWFALQAISMPVFLLVMRALPLAGYHAAEHQAVHAMERSEPLRPEVVRRMPRVHPRCGTNLMAAGMVFGTTYTVLPALQIAAAAMDRAVIAGIVSFFTWRTVGSFLQQYFTTRPATDRQIASGIAAACSLEHKYLNSVIRRPRLLRRLWCTGLAQVSIGAAITGTAALYFFTLLSHELK